MGTGSHRSGVLYKTFRKDFFIAGFWCLGESTTRILQPLFLGKLLSALLAEDHVQQAIFASLLIAVAFIQIFVHHALYFYTMRGGWNARMACSGLIHSKLLRLHCAEIQKASSGRIASWSQTTWQSLTIFSRLHWMGGIFDFFVIGYLIVLEVGFLSAAAGVAVVVQPCLSKFTSGSGLRGRLKNCKWTDKRSDG